VRVLAREGQPIPTVVFGDPDPTLGAPPGWPPLQLLSGGWLDRTGQPMNLPTGLRWWDRSGLAPVAAALGPVAPAAMFQVLNHDLLVSV
jgi:hypothetical protein